MHLLHKTKLIFIMTMLAFCMFAIHLSAVDESGIKNFTATYVQAFNSRNVDQLSSLWALDASYINLSTHETLQGREEIKNYFHDQFKEESYSTLEINIVNINQVQEGKASEKGIAIVKSKEGPENKSFFLAELVRSNDAWVLQKVIELEDQPAPSHYEQLKDLAWLEGQWESKNEFTTLSLNVKWDENKNFLIQNFVVSILDQKNLAGKHIIGWDQINKKIFSWSIDSDGGFGQGIWRKQGDHWYVEISFTLPDGRKASVTNVYKKIDDRTFTFASENRDLNGKILPDVEPFTFKKI